MPALPRSLLTILIVLLATYAVPVLFHNATIDFILIGFTIITAAATLFIWELLK